MSKLFGDSGLRATSAAAAVTDLGPLAYGADGQFWAYRNGVWRPGAGVVHRRIVDVLDERYRPNHANAIEGVLRARLPELEVAPVVGLINFADTMVDWAAAEIPAAVPHDPAHGSTVQLPVRWATENTDCTAFDVFLAQSVPADDVRRVWEILGYLLMSGNPLQRLFLLTGGGGNGKGVLMAVILALIGRANVSSVTLHDFTDSQFSTAEIHGKLANICGDIDTTYIERTGVLKKMAGEDLIPAQRKYGQPFEFEFWGKALFSANGIPTAADGTRGWLRRWEIVNFPNEPEKPDPELKARLTRPAVLEAIAVRAVLALRGLMERRNFDHGESASMAHDEFAKRNNTLLAWIEDCGYLDPEARVARTVLLKSFRWWSADQNPGGRAINAATFYERLESIPGVRKVTVKGERSFRGLRLKDGVHYVDMTDDTLHPAEGVQDDPNQQSMF